MSTERKPSLGLRKRLIEAAVEDTLVAFCVTRRQKPGKACDGRDARRPGFSDEQLWAKFAWRFGWGMLRELTLQGVAEMREHRRTLEDSDKPKVLQPLINGIWKNNKHATTRKAAGKEAR